MIVGKNGTAWKEKFSLSVVRVFPGWGLLALAFPAWGQSLVDAPPAQAAARPTTIAEEPAWKGTELPKTKTPAGISDEQIRLLRAEAAANDPEALWRLAGVAASTMDAFEFMRRAAELGDHRAEYELASMYAEGRGTAQDLDKALGWGRKAAEAGHPLAQASLGLTLLKSEKGTATRDEGLAWLEKSSSAGNKRAALLLSAIYAQGALGVPMNELRAGDVLRSFAEKDDAECQVALASVYLFAKLHENERGLAIVWLQRAKENGHPEADKILKEIQEGKSEE